MTFISMRMKIISISKAEHVTSFWSERPGGTRNDLLLVCTWRHGGRVDGQELKHLSPCGTKLHFHEYSSWKNSVVLTTKMAALSRGCKPRISFPNSGRLMISIMIFTASKWFSNARRVSVKRKNGQSIWYWGMIYKKSAFQKLHFARFFCSCFFAWEISFVRSAKSSMFFFRFFLWSLHFK